VTNEILEHRFYNALHEKDDELKNQSDEEKYKEDLINKLEDNTYLNLKFSHIVEFLIYIIYNKMS
ncbi:hypothetical protein, partial [Helcococcus ovis]|uniref:hypothetical protein n=1 Tax=Helcococcus ovis TaxID=72026 RepID=UPI001ADCF722